MAAMLSLKPTMQVMSASKSSFAGSRLSIAQAPATVAQPLRLNVEMSRRCEFTKKKANNGYTVSFSHTRNKTLQHVNVQSKKIFWEKEKRWVHVKIATSTLKTITKKGIDAVAKDCGIDLYSLPYTDVSDARVNWLKENNAPPKKKNKRAMKQPTPA
eukprot:CAMPEP_0118929550 /NCGR_PEP_ID=MMETSP1169-20130426/6518_1 /TAXON_ID=36882 /ORGANISM="Pyramimonas obovata, Strain CCMP722" /LENGTH=156 /DNA_ID=CAMNT_0006871765 /DNA_START=63 /DNA_END=533 /DNA_ORIENTATION=+